MLFPHKSLLEEIKTCILQKYPNIDEGLVIIFLHVMVGEMSEIDAYKLLKDNIRYINIIEQIDENIFIELLGARILIKIHHFHGWAIITFSFNEEIKQIRIYLSKPENRKCKIKDRRIVFFINRLLILFCFSVTMAVILYTWTDLSQTLIEIITFILSATNFYFPDITNRKFLRNYLVTFILIVYLTVITYGMWQPILGVVAPL